MMMMMMMMMMLLWRHSEDWSTNREPRHLCPMSFLSFPHHPSLHTPLSSDIMFLSLVKECVKIIVANCDCHLEIISSFTVTDTAALLHLMIFTEYIVCVVVTRLSLSLSGGHMLLLNDCWRIMELISFVLASYYFEWEDLLLFFVISDSEWNVFGFWDFVPFFFFFFLHFAD